MAQVTRTVIVKGDIDRVYKLWSNFEMFPRFMNYITAVTVTGPRTTHWVMKGPWGLNVDWNAEMTRLEPNKRIAWNSKDARGFITTSGQVTFNALSGHEAQVTVTMHYVPPAGKAGEFFTRLFARPDQRLDEDLRNFKAFAEGMPDRSTA